jgi:hypothetical protein
MNITFQAESYKLVQVQYDPYISNGYIVCFCDKIALEFQPVIYDPFNWGCIPFPPEYMAYRGIYDKINQTLCILYELYWLRQDCTWREMNKDHDHDYEQFQVHLNLEKEVVDKVIVSSVGPAESAFHGVEVYHHTEITTHSQEGFVTSTTNKFPWGGIFGKKRHTFVRSIPIKKLEFQGNRPVTVVLNCYHAFTGSKGTRNLSDSPKLNPKLRKLDEKLLHEWYWVNKKNRYGRDVSNPLQFPHVMYSPPPEKWFPNLCYDILWKLYSLRYEKKSDNHIIRTR